MRITRNLPPILLAVVLVAFGVAYYSTRDRAGGPTTNRTSVNDQRLVDTSLLETALKLAPLAATSEEQGPAREAWRLADHELDLTFAGALRGAAAQAAAAPPSGPLRQLSDRIAKLKQRVEDDKQRVADLQKDGGQDFDLAQAQLDLDQDELDDAQQDLAREGGDRRARLQRLLEEHEASEKIADQGIKFGTPGPIGTLAEQVGQWTALRSYIHGLQNAAQQASEHARALLERHNRIEAQVPAQPEPNASAARLRQLSIQRKILANLDQRVQDSKELATVYQRWAGVVAERQRHAVHAMFRSLGAIAAILLAAVLAIGAIRRGFRRTARRPAQQFRIIARLVVQVVALLLILLIAFGPPTQLSTMIGLVTAGLAVVMKDFIVAFFGWFTLMGKNGIRVGDWVEIEGVSGEVLEIGIFKTVLLELGNWSETGLPTGRRVAFSNSFAMERHYFNFSTSGQWLWDELQIGLPSSGDPYRLAEEIRDIVERETQADAAEAAEDFQRVTHQYGARDFSGAPAVSLRPGANGLQVVVRYITRAPQRNAVKSKLFQDIVEILRKPVHE